MREGKVASPVYFLVLGLVGGPPGGTLVGDTARSPIIIPRAADGRRTPAAAATGQELQGALPVTPVDARRPFLELTCKHTSLKCTGWAGVRAPKHPGLGADHEAATPRSPPEPAFVSAQQFKRSPAGCPRSTSQNQHGP